MTRIANASSRPSARFAPRPAGRFTPTYGEERAATEEAKLKLKLRRWREADLKSRAKGEAGIVAMAARLRAETTLTVVWIAERLGMGTRGHLNHLLYRGRKSEGQ